MTVLSVSTPENKTLISVQKAMNLFLTGKKVLVELKEGEQVYAAHILYHKYSSSVNLPQFAEFVAMGTWYIIEDN